MILRENDLLAGQTASNLRTLLISEIQEFIHSLEQKLSIDELTRKRDRIRQVYAVLSMKENVEFDQIAGKYFYTFMSERSDNNRLE